MTPKCICCGHSDLIENISVMVQYIGGLPVIICQKPKSTFFQKTKIVRTHSKVCAGCGYVMMFVSAKGIASLRGDS